MSKLIVSLLGLPASGKSMHGEKLAKENGIKFIPEVGTQLILEKNFKAGVNAAFEFDNTIFMKNRILVKEILNSREKKIILEGGPTLDAFYLEGRAKFGKHKESRLKLLEAYKLPAFINLEKNCHFIFLNIPPGISLNRQEERNKPELMTPEIELLDFVHQKLLEFYRKNKEKTILINLMGKTEEQVYQELTEKFSAFLEK